jgi:methyl-accepting chemotaxis protein
VLIQNSVEKAELGARIAGETASSLTEIVTGINESSQIVSEIAQSSDEQSGGIAQISQGINRVGQLVRETNATAQDSASAAEEMSGQANMLDDLILRFRQDSHMALPPGR